MYQCAPEQAQSEGGICYFRVFTTFAGMSGIEVMFATNAYIYSSAFYKL